MSVEAFERSPEPQPLLLVVMMTNKGEVEGKKHGSKESYGKVIYFLHRVVAPCAISLEQNDQILKRRKIIKPSLVQLCNNKMSISIGASPLACLIQKSVGGRGRNDKTPRKSLKGHM